MLVTVVVLKTETGVGCRVVVTSAVDTGARIMLVPTTEVAVTI